MVCTLMLRLLPVMREGSGDDDALDSTKWALRDSRRTFTLSELDESVNEVVR